MSADLGEQIRGLIGFLVLLAAAWVTYRALCVLHARTVAVLHCRRGLIMRRYVVRDGEAWGRRTATIEVREVVALGAGLSRVRATQITIDPPDPEMHASLEQTWCRGSVVVPSNSVYWIVPQRTAPAAPPERRP